MGLKKLANVRTDCSQAAGIAVARQLRITDLAGHVLVDPQPYPTSSAEQHRLVWRVGRGVGHGLRRGEALGLAWADVDLGGAANGAAGADRVDGRLRLDSVKTDAPVAVLPLRHRWSVS